MMIILLLLLLLPLLLLLLLLLLLMIFIIIIIILLLLLLLLLPLLLTIIIITIIVILLIVIIQRPASRGSRDRKMALTPNLPAKIVLAQIARLKLSGKLPMGLGIPPLKIKILLESNALTSRILVQRLGVAGEHIVRDITCCAIHA